MSDNTPTRCHTFMYAREDCPHFLKGCVVCGGLGYVQDDPTKPGVPCPAGCDEGVVVTGVKEHD